MPTRILTGRNAASVLAFGSGICFALGAFAQNAIPDVTYVPPPNVDGILSSMLGKVSPGIDFVASGALASAIIVAVLLWLRKSFKGWLSPEPATETSRLWNLGIAFVLGVSFGILGIAPAIPIAGVDPLLARILGGFFAATCAVFGRDFLVRGKGMFDERKAEAADPRPEIQPPLDIPPSTLDR